MKNLVIDVYDAGNGKHRAVLMQINADGVRSILDMHEEPTAYHAADVILGKVMPEDRPFVSDDDGVTHDITETFLKFKSRQARVKNVIAAIKEHK